MQRKKTAIITARMTPGIKDLIQHRARQAGMTVTDYIITCALGKEIVRVDGLDEMEDNCLWQKTKRRFM